MPLIHLSRQTGRAVRFWRRKPRRVQRPLEFQNAVDSLMHQTRLIGLKAPRRHSRLYQTGLEFDPALFLVPVTGAGNPIK